jgi:uncharacterized glyoxalase superfamily metalloenzyme YdcJ
MRLKFKKGFVPEHISKIFLEKVHETGRVIGSVNIYIQTYDDDMQSEVFDDNKEYWEYENCEENKEGYAEYAAWVRRSKMKAVK